MQRAMRVDGEVVPLGDRAFDVVQALVEAAGTIVLKTDLMDRIWPNVAVGDNALQMHVSAIRKDAWREAGLVEDHIRSRLPVAG